MSSFQASVLPLLSVVVGLIVPVVVGALTVLALLLGQDMFLTMLKVPRLHR